MTLPNPLDAVYGRFELVTPDDAAALLRGFTGRWWVAGGWAIQAFTGMSRVHEDLDICVERSRIPDIVRHFEGSHHVWAAGSGAMKALLSPRDVFPHWAGQLWIREDATSPWLIDFLISPVVDGKWIYKRDAFITRPFDEATWRADDGIVYESPEISLLYKAKHDREKDRRDLVAALPHMSRDAISWLSENLAKTHPGHPWLGKL